MRCSDGAAKVKTCISGMKNKIFSIVVLIFFSVALQAQLFEWKWAKGVGDVPPDEGKSIAIDKFGNVYITGYFRSTTLTFDSININRNNVVQGSLYTDFFVAKYDSSGNVLWAKSEGGVWDEYGACITTDLSGNIYVAGNFNSPFFVLGYDTLTNIGSFDVFIVKYDSQGNKLWAKSVGGTTSEDCNSIVTDFFGNVYVTGRFSSSTIAFDTIVLNNNGGSNDVFIAKYDLSGNILWAKSFGGNKNDYGKSITVDKGGNIYVTGDFFSDSINIDNRVLYNFDSSTSDFFVAKYNPFGILLWAKNFGGNNNDFGNSITTDTEGNIYVAGKFSSNILVFDTSILTNIEGYDVYVSKFDSLGNLLWAKQGKANGNNDNSISSIDTDETGNVYAVGFFDSPSITFDNDTLMKIRAGYSGWINSFIVKYNNSGNVYWTSRIGGNGSDYCYSVATGPKENVFVTGAFTSSNLDFGNTTIHSVYGLQNIFIAKLIDFTVGVNDVNRNSLIRVYPNPSTGSFNLRVSSKTNNIIVTNTLGRILQTKSIDENETVINFSLSENGIYFLNIISAEGIFTKKILVLK
jgi:hypothetical protein